MAVNGVWMTVIAIGAIVAGCLGESGKEFPEPDHPIPTPDEGMVKDPDDAEPNVGEAPPITETPVASEIVLLSTGFLFAYFAPDWDTVADMLPAGFDPAGYPHLPIAGTYYGAPEGTLGTILVGVFAYDQADVDGVKAGPGNIAMAWAVAKVPSDYAQFYSSGDWGAAFVWLGATVTDPLIEESLASWDIPVAVGDIFSSTDPSDLFHHSADVIGGPLEFEMSVTQPAIYPSTGPIPAPLVQFTSDGTSARHVLKYTVPAHRALVGPAVVEGEIGALGQFSGAGAYGQYAWFGSSPVPAGDTGEVVLRHVADLQDLGV